jgi:hypothetical protein
VLDATSVLDRSPPQIFGVRRASETNAKVELTVAATVDDIQADA